MYFYMSPHRQLRIPKRAFWNPDQRIPKPKSLLKEKQRQALATEDDRGMPRIRK